MQPAITGPNYMDFSLFRYNLLYKVRGKVNSPAASSHMCLFAQLKECFIAILILHTVTYFNTIC